MGGSTVRICRRICFCWGLGKEAVVAGRGGTGGLTFWGIVWGILSMDCLFIVNQSEPFGMT